MPEIETFHFDDDGEIPNNPRLPLVIYRRALSLAGERDPAAPFERLFAAHGRLAASDDLLVVGAYPRTGTFDQQRPGQADHTRAVAAVAAVPLPEQDPVQGGEGPLMALWKVS